MPKRLTNVAKCRSKNNLTETTLILKKVTNSLAKRLGIDRRLLGKAIEKIKKFSGRGGKDNIVIDEFGNVLDDNGEILGNVFDEYVK